MGLMLTPGARQTVLQHQAGGGATVLPLPNSRASAWQQAACDCVEEYSSMRFLAWHVVSRGASMKGRQLERRKNTNIVNEHEVS